jgi:competence ComEA-like helix-hairpin-helix protein
LATLCILLSFGGSALGNSSSVTGGQSKAGNTSIVDINHAGIEELTTLPGIGKTTAQKIIEFREKNGPFRRVEELLIIRGISEKRLKQIRPRLSLGNEQKPMDSKTKDNESNQGKYQKARRKG